MRSGGTRRLGEGGGGSAVLHMFLVPLTPPPPVLKEPPHYNKPPQIDRTPGPETARTKMHRTIAQKLHFSRHCLCSLWIVVWMEE